MNALNNFDKTDREYSTAPTDDLIRFWRSKVKVTAGRRGDKGIHVDAVDLKSIFYTVSIKKVTPCIHFHNSVKQCRILICMWIFLLFFFSARNGE